MKTKLLKKVRKQFTITRIDKVGVNSYYTNAQERFGVPFYVIEDKKDEYRMW